MIPFGFNTVTLIRRAESRDEAGRTHTTWKRVILSGCSWRAQCAAQLSESMVSSHPKVICRIPAGQPHPHVGDVLLLGDVDASPATATDVDALLICQRDKGAFRVTSVGDYTQAGTPLPHCVAKGDAL